MGFWDFWFDEFGFPYFYIRGEILLFLTSGTSVFFFLSPSLPTFTLSPTPTPSTSKASSFCYNGVQRESPVRPGLCLLQLDRRPLQLRPLDQHRLGRRFPYASFLSPNGVMVLTWVPTRHRKCQQMVPGRRPGLHPRGLGHGHGHDPRSRLFILGIGSPKVCPEYDLGLYGFVLDRDLPMVFLGLFACFLPDGDQRLYRQPAKLRFNEDLG